MILFTNLLQIALILFICLLGYECGAEAMRWAVRAGKFPPADVVNRETPNVDASKIDADDDGDYDSLSGVESSEAPTLPPTPPPRNPAV